jgi:hypothetical protein
MKKANYGRISTSVAEPLFSLLAKLAEEEKVRPSTLVKRLVLMALADIYGEKTVKELFKKSYIDQICVYKRDLDYLMQPFFSKEEIEKALPKACIKHINNETATLR